jgi:hypothetical protein
MTAIAKRDIEASNLTDMKIMLQLPADVQPFTSKVDNFYFAPFPALLRGRGFYPSESLEPIW